MAKAEPPSSPSGSTNPFELPPHPLLARPANTATRRLFVAATRMNDGKTTTCLGLFAALQHHFNRVGFIKPIGQRFIEVAGHMVDEDSVLLDTIYHVHVPIESMSPVAVDATFTRRFLQSPDTILPKLIDRICRGFDRVSWEKDFTLIEGTGHAGVGSVFELSNARVARLLDAPTVIVCPGGIGRPIDEIALNQALFEREGVPVIGAILNKVDPNKLDQITDYAGRGLARLGIPLLGVLPVQKILSAPNLNQIIEEIGGRWLNAPATGVRQRVHRVIVGAMTAQGIVEHLRPGTLIITPGDRDDIILAAISAAQMSREHTFAGLILTNGMDPNPTLRDMLHQTSIPVILARGESYTVTTRINSLTVKTQPDDTDKVPIIKRLITEHVQLDRLLAALNPPPAARA